MDYYSGVSPSLVSSLPDFGSEFWKSDTMFDLKYCNWNKDMLMGVLPNSQFGDVSVVNLELTGDGSKVGFRTTDGKFVPAVSAAPFNLQYKYRPYTA